MTNPKRLYETERKRQQRARIAAGQVHKVVVYLTENQFEDVKEVSLIGDPADGIVTLIESDGIRCLMSRFDEHSPPRQTTTHNP